MTIDRRAILAGSVALAAAPAWAQGDAGVVRVALKTAKGVITLDLAAGKAPVTTHNFLRYVDLKRLDGSTFYRTSHADGAPEIGVIQGGLRGDPRKVFRPIAFESTIKTGLSHKDGTISMAADAPGKATADYFICLGDQPYFDADPSDPTGKPGFAAFGQVVDGMDVVRAIHDLPTSATAGGANMRGEMLSPPVVVRTVRRVA